MARHEKGHLLVSFFSGVRGSNRIAAEGGVALERAQRYIIMIFGVAEGNYLLRSNSQNIYRTPYGAPEKDEFSLVLFCARYCKSVRFQKLQTTV